MDVNQDYEDLFKILNKHKIKYLVIGAYAVMYYTEPRYTKDIDILISDELNDSLRVHQALKDFGAPLKNTTPDDFKNKKLIYQIGVEPVRIDILVNLPDISIQQAWKNRKKAIYGKTPIHVLGERELISVKKNANRPQDIIDVEKILRYRKSSAIK